MLRSLLNSSGTSITPSGTPWTPLQKEFVHIQQAQIRPALVHGTSAATVISNESAGLAAEFGQSVRCARSRHGGQLEVLGPVATSSGWELFLVVGSKGQTTPDYLIGACLSQHGCDFPGLYILHKVGHLLCCWVKQDHLLTCHLGDAQRRSQPVGWPSLLSCSNADPWNGTCDRLCLILYAGLC